MLDNELFLKICRGLKVGADMAKQKGSVINWKIFWILWIASLVSVVLLTPYLYALEAPELAFEDFLVELLVLYAISYGIVYFLGFIWLLKYLPTAYTIIEVTPFIIVCVLVLNMVLGTIFGCLYWKGG